MKILLVSQYFYPENFKINDLIFSLKKRGHDITVLTGKPNYSKKTFYDGYGWKSDDFETIFDIPVYRANLLSRGNGGAIRLFLNYISFAIFALFKIKKIQGTFDIIFVYQTSPVTVGIPAVFAKKVFKAPIYFWVLDQWPETLVSMGIIRSKFLMYIFSLLSNTFRLKPTLE